MLNLTLDYTQFKEKAAPKGTALPIFYFSRIKY
jgi:hypothetical protein